MGGVGVGGVGVGGVGGGCPEYDPDLSPKFNQLFLIG